MRGAPRRMARPSPAGYRTAGHQALPFPARSIDETHQNSFLPLTGLARGSKNRAARRVLPQRQAPPRPPSGTAPRIPIGPMTYGITYSRPMESRSPVGTVIPLLDSLLLDNGLAIPLGAKCLPRNCPKTVRVIGMSSVDCRSWYESSTATETDCAERRPLKLREKRGRNPGSGGEIHADDP